MSTELRWVNNMHKILHPIYKSSLNHGIPEHWVAGLIRVECASMNPRASRFEPHVFRAVMQAKEGKRNPNFPGFMSGRIKAFIDSTDNQDDLKSLATSYGVGQIMGYHYVNKWDMKPKQYTQLSMGDSIRYTMRMMADGMKWAKSYPELLRWWNTGSVNGKTYHAHYVDTASRTAAAYLSILSGTK